MAIIWLVLLFSSSVKALTNGIRPFINKVPRDQQHSKRNLKVEDDYYSLATTYEAATGQDGAMFDVVSKSTELMMIVDVSLNLISNTTPYLEVYYREGTFVGHGHSKSEWNMAIRSIIYGKGRGNPSRLGDNSLVIPLAPLVTTGLYMTITSRDAYMAYDVSLQGVGAVYSQDQNVQILEGVGKAYPFGKAFAPRLFSGTLHYMFPSSEPSGMPSYGPSLKPSRLPSNEPIAKPSVSPSIYPSDLPSRIPSSRPSFHPSHYPSALPSTNPSDLRQPSSYPSNEPSDVPSRVPTRKPSFIPSISFLPSAFPSAMYIPRASTAPSHTPSRSLSVNPSISTKPTTSTNIPTINPTLSNRPSFSPSTSNKPTISNQPTSRPSASYNPSVFPSRKDHVTLKSTIKPTTKPTPRPTAKPSTKPTYTFVPSKTFQPSVAPSAIPNESNSMQPSVGITLRNSWPDASAIYPTTNPSFTATTKDVISNMTSSPVPTVAFPFKQNFTSQIPSTTDENLYDYEPSTTPTLYWKSTSNKPSQTYHSLSDSGLSATVAVISASAGAASASAAVSSVSAGSNGTAASVSAVAPLNNQAITNDSLLHNLEEVETSEVSDENETKKRKKGVKRQQGMRRYVYTPTNTVTHCSSSSKRVLNSSAASKFKEPQYDIDSSSDGLERTKYYAEKDIESGLSQTCRRTSRRDEGNDTSGQLHYEIVG